MPIYLTADEIKDINQRFLGAPALRDEHALLSALARPLTVAYYQQADIALQAAALIDGIAQAHAFVDANKRTASAAALVFLRVNGWRLHYTPHPTQDPFGQEVLALVNHQTTADDLARWIRSRLVAIP